MSQKFLVVVLGPTAVGKTSVSISLAERLKCEIISADSRQFYKQLKIGTAAPTTIELNRIKHHFVSFLNPDDYYNASRFEYEALEKLNILYEKNDVMVLTGGSMLYVDAVLNGIDVMPDVDPEIRAVLYTKFQNEGIEPLRLQLKKLDPAYYSEVDLKNHVRIIHALEICLTTGKPFSNFRRKMSKQRPFVIIKIGLDLPREILFERINERVKHMLNEGLVDEVKSLMKFRDYNALNTVGYREIYEYLDGNYTLERAMELIQRNTRRYAKKQLTWFKRDTDTTWFHPEDIDTMSKHILQKMKY